MKSRILGVTVACAAFLVSACLVSACKSNATATSDSPDAGAAGTAASAPSVPAGPVASSAAPAPAPSGSGPQSPLAIPGATVAALPNMSFPERFANEAKGRPPGIKPNADEVYAALKAAGVEIVDIRQHLASPQGARYCLGARVLDAAKQTRLDISVCEYSTPDVARIGRDYSLDALKTVVPNRTMYVNKQTTLTLREAAKTPENDALVEKASGVFAKL